MKMRMNIGISLQLIPAIYAGITPITTVVIY